jgi:amino acid adenylation domain-containing protein
VQAVPEVTLPRLFEEQAEKTPGAVAVVCGGQEITYQELNERANRLGRLLIAKGVRLEDVVGLAVGRSVEMVVALLGILKAGAAFLPIDAYYPAERMAFMLSDAEPVCLLTTSETADRLPDNSCRLILDHPETVRALAQCATRNPTDQDGRNSLRLENSAYVIYTSGSSGRPKGVVVSHKGIAALCKSQEERLAVDTQSRILQFASPSFDASVWEVVMALGRGASLVLLEEESRSGRALQEAINENQVTHATLPPSVLATLEISAGLHLETLVVAGEACGGELVSQWATGRRMINAYGPTETTVCATMSEPLSSRSEPSIGRPILNTRIYVLDGCLQIAPAGVRGALYIAGESLARGYLKEAALTAERFLPDPYGAPGTRMYRTGDLARWGVDGNVEFLGRADEQVKIRGFRIEPGEVEAALRECPDVAQAVVMAREDRPGEKRLVGYVVAAPGQSIDPGEMRRRLAERLPDNMVPAAIVGLEALPLTPNGKIDRKALPEPELASTSAWWAPRNPKEEVLCALFAEALGLERVGINDNFFELGGHSLVATRLASLARATLGIDLSIRSLFETPTVAGLALKLSHPADQSALQVMLPLRSQGSRPPLFCIHPAGGLGWCYARLMPYISVDYPIYGLQARHLTEPEYLPATVEEMAADYVDQIRKVQPAGPYNLIGWSFGGLIAQAIAGLFQQQGEGVAMLAILDSYPQDIHQSPESMTRDELIARVCQYLGYGVEDKSSDTSSLIERYRDTEEYPLDAFVECAQNDLSVVNNFIPQRYVGNLLLFTATDSETDAESKSEAWAPYISGELEIRPIPCQHGDMLLDRDPSAQIGQALAAELSKLNQRRK